MNDETGYFVHMLELDAKAAEARIQVLSRRRRRLKRLAVSAVLLGVLTVVSAVGAALWLVGTPDGLQVLLPRIVGQDRASISLERVAVHPTSELTDPTTWGLFLYDLRIEPHDPTRPRVTIDQMLIIGPDLLRLWEQRELHMRRAVLVGLHIDAQQQRATEPRDRPEGALRLLSADHASLWDARYTAPADDPLPAAAFTGIYAEVNDMSYAPFERHVHGVGSLQGAYFMTGDLIFSNIMLNEVIATGPDLAITQGSLRWEGVTARMHGTLKGIERRATVALQVSLSHARLEALVRNATGQPSPVFGFADITLSVHSGGDLPRGGGNMHAAVRLTEVKIPLPEGMRGIYKDAIRLAPIVSLDDKDQVILEEMVGHLTVTRGLVTLHDLLYKSKIPVLVKGSIDTDALDLYFRVVLGGDPATHPGVGLRLHGPHGSPEASRATRDELLPGWKELKQEARDERRERRRDRRDARNADETPDPP